PEPLVLQTLEQRVTGRLPPCLQGRKSTTMLTRLGGGLLCVALAALGTAQRFQVAWNTYYTRPQTETVESYLTAKLDQAGNAYVLGIIDTGGISLVLSKYSPDGVAAWHRTWAISSDFTSMDLDVRPDGSALVMAEHAPTTQIRRFDALGN